MNISREYKKRQKTVNRKRSIIFAFSFFSGIPIVSRTQRHDSNLFMFVYIRTCKDIYIYIFYIKDKKV